jgi:glycyl-tRNA synthetase
VPQSSIGLAVGLADRLDSLAGLFGAGKDPSGAGDPFALRRTAIGLIEALVASGQSFDLRRGLALAADLQPIEVDQDIQGRCLAFITRRQQALLLAEGRRHDAVTAVLEAQGHDPAAAAVAVMQLEAWIGADGWDSLLQNFARCIRITRDLDQVYVVDEDKLSEDASRQLLAAYQKAAGTDGSLQSIDALFRAFEPMVPDVEHFFEEVLVMSEDEAERRNRLGLLQRVAGLADGLLDVSKLEGF